MRERQRIEEALGYLGDQARMIREVFAKHEVEYMFIGKGAAMAQGLNAMSRDLDIYPSKRVDNRKRLLAALEELGLSMVLEIKGKTVSLGDEVLAGKDFIQFLEPFDLDVVFAPDGFENYEEASRYKIVIDGYRNFCT